MVEAPNLDVNVTRQEIIKLFRLGGRIVMDSEEQAEFDKLPEQLTIYRGITDYNKKHIKGISWTLDIDIASYFAHRFRCKGKVYKATIQKKYVLAYYQNRGENEVVVDYRKLEGITQEFPKE